MQRRISMRMAIRTLVAALFCFQACLANVEKTIFLGPEAANVPLQPPTLEDLHLDVLTPQNWSLRTQIEARFPDSASEKGESSWFLLDGLTQGQRYEVRICWAATQPTAFSLKTYELSEVWDSPELIGSLAGFSARRQTEAGSRVLSTGERRASVLFLRILAAADYYTTDAALMRDVPPVRADVILDPFLFNVFPRSLVPTAGLIVVVAVASYFVAGFLISWIRGVAASPDDSSADAQKKRQ